MIRFFRFNLAHASHCGSMEEKSVSREGLSGRASGDYVKPPTTPDPFPQTFFESNWEWELSFDLSIKEVCNYNGQQQQQQQWEQQDHTVQTTSTTTTMRFRAPNSKSLTAMSNGNKLAHSPFRIYIIVFCCWFPSSIVCTVLSILILFVSDIIQTFHR